MKIHVSTDEGELIETIDVDDYDLSMPLARLALLDEIIEAIERRDGKKPDRTEARSGQKRKGLSSRV